MTSTSATAPALTDYSPPSRLGHSFSISQLRQLLSMPSSVICEGSSSLCNLVQDVVDALTSCNHSPIQKLVLCNASLDHLHVSRLQQILHLREFALTSVVLAGIQMNRSALATFATALVNDNSRLEQLVLEDCEIGSAGAVAITEALVSNRTLWKLDLSKNHISDSACHGLGRMVQANTTLRVRCPPLSASQPLASPLLRCYGHRSST